MRSQRRGDIKRKPRSREVLIIVAVIGRILSTHSRYFTRVTQSGDKLAPEKVSESRSRMLFFIHENPK